MRITEVRLRKVNSEGKMKAVASVTIDDQFVVHELKVVQGQNGLFVSMPSRQRPSGHYVDIAHPITPEARQIIQESVLQAYERAALSRTDQKQPVRS